MWYKSAKQKVNLFGKPISDKPKVKTFQSTEDVDETLVDEKDSNEPVVDDKGIEIPQIDQKPVEISIDDPTPEDPFTPEDLQTVINEIDQDPTSIIKLPAAPEDYGEIDLGLHENCRCKIVTIPIRSKLNVQEGRRIWKHAENCCESCLLTAREFNQAEIIRLRNLGIDVNAIS